MKETFYFTHDYNSRSDEKIKLLIRKTGMQGYGIFWALIEDLYSNANALRTDYEGIAYDYRIDALIIESIINDFDLFVIKDGFFGSLSVERRLSERELKSKKASKSALSRWSQCDINANASNEKNNALHEQCECNAIKERKGKEIKESKEKESKGEEIKSNTTPFNFFLHENNILSQTTSEFINSQMWLETKAMQLEIDLETIIQKAKEFLIDIRDRDLIQGKSLTDLRAHFVSWFKKKRESEQKNGKRVKYLEPEL